MRLEEAARMGQTFIGQWEDHRRQFGGRVEPLAADLTTMILVNHWIHGLQVLPDLHVEEARMFLWMVLWVQNGCPVFAPTASLSAKLLLTDPKGLTMDVVGFPFDAFAILPHAPDAYRIINQEGRPTGTAFMAVLRSHLPSDLDLLQEYQVSVWKTKQKLAKGRLSVSDTKALLDRGIEFGMRIRHAPQDELLSLFLQMSDGKGTAFHSRTWDGNRSVMDWLEGRDRSSGLVPFAEEDRIAIRSAGRLLLNLLVYVNEERRERRWSPAIERRPPKVPGVPRRKVWTMGSEIKLPRELREAADEYCRGGNAHTALWKIQRRFVVMGHHHRYWYGERNSPSRELRVRWLQPYYKGPEEGPRIGRRRYAVDEVVHDVKE